MTAPVSDDAAKQRKVNPVLLVALGVVAVGAVVYLVTSLGGGGSSPPAAPAPGTTASPAAPAPSPSPTAAPSPAASPISPPETFELFESKDPFRPLVVAGTGGGGSGTGTTGGTTGGGTTGGTGATPSPTPATSPGPGAGGAPAPAGGQPVELLDVIDDEGTAKAQVKVGDTVHTVATGETFASTFKVLSISGTCATMLNGDDKFTLCKGEQVVK